MKDRLGNLREKLAEKELDALLVSTPENRHYLSGFTGSAGYLLISRSQAILATDFRYVEQAGMQAPGFQVVKTSGDWSWLREELERQEYGKLAFESQHLTVATYRRITEELRHLPPPKRPRLAATSGLADVLRSVKEEGELAQLQKAIDVSDSAIQSVPAAINAGDTEREVAWRLERAMRDFGADSVSFDTIVAAGPNGAMPHHRPSDRPIKQGEPIVIDMGAKVGGYCSDITRTFCIGEPDETFRKVYDIVLGAQLTAIATVRPGMTGKEADKLARVVIEEAGYGDNFGHSLGHGLGLVVHEHPGVGPRSENTLDEGMVFTVEPGIYISGWGGVRIEDVVLLGSDGARVLSGAPK